MKASKDDIWKELVETRIRLRNCQKEYEEEHEGRIIAEALIRARESTIEAYRIAKMEVAHWINEDIKKRREISALNRTIAKYEELYGKLEAK
jgi:hypothetical protein